MRETPCLPGWSIVKRLGAGSFGTVYEIEKTENGITRKAAMKVLSVPTDPEAVSDYFDSGYVQTEAEATAYVDRQVADITEEYKVMNSLKAYRNILEVKGCRVLPHEGWPGADILIVMELLIPLTQYMRTHELREEQIIELGIDICRALEACHGMNPPILHRDIKMSNIMMSPEGTFKLGDFGVARVMEGSKSAHTKAGTEDYMAPEVIQMQGYRATADIYSLGMVLYRLLNRNRGPFLPAEGPVNEAMHMQARRDRVTGKPLPDPKMGSDRLKQAVKKAIAYRPEHRYHSAEAFRLALEQCQESREDFGGYETFNSEGAPVAEASRPVFERREEKPVTDSEEMTVFVRQEDPQPTPSVRPTPPPIPPASAAKPAKKGGVTPLIFAGIAVLVIAVGVIGMLGSRGSKSSLSGGAEQQAAATASDNLESYDAEIANDPKGFVEKLDLMLRTAETKVTKNEKITYRDGSWTDHGKDDEDHLLIVSDFYPDASQFSITRYMYDDKDRTVCAAIYDDQNRIVQFTVNDMGPDQISVSNDYYVDPDTGAVTKIEWRAYEYNADGNMVSNQRYVNDQLAGVMLTNWKDKDHRSSSFSYNPDNSLSWGNEYEWDDQERLIRNDYKSPDYSSSETITYSDDEIIGERITKYGRYVITYVADEDAWDGLRKISSEEYRFTTDADGKQSEEYDGRDENIYDADNHWVGSRSMDENGNLSYEDMTIVGGSVFTSYREDQASTTVSLYDARMATYRRYYLSEPYSGPEQLEEGSPCITTIEDIECDIYRNEVRVYTRRFEDGVQTAEYLSMETDYNEYGGRLAIRDYNENGILSYKSTFDGNGHQLGYDYFDEAGKLSSRTEFIYDDNWNRTGENMYDGDGNMIRSN